MSALRCTSHPVVKPSVVVVRRSVPVRASGGEGQPKVVGEDVLARLRAAEEEAAKLRKQLEQAQQQNVQPVSADVIEAKPIRIDSIDKRETLMFVENKERSSWLSEADVDFFTGGSPGEESGPALSAEEQATVNRRILIGGVLTVAAAAFALVPTEKLQMRPSKPMFFYLTPILRSKALLEQSKDIINNAEWDSLRLLLSRITGDPNNVKDNLKSVVALLDDPKTAENANTLAAEFYEYIITVDFNKYFDSVPNQVLTGKQNAEYADFSTKALKAAQSKLDAFLKLVPTEQLEAASSQVLAFY